MCLRHLSSLREHLHVDGDYLYIYIRFLICDRRPVGASRNPEQYSSSGTMKWVDDARYLGVTLDKGLTWSKHIDRVRKKAAQTGNAGTSPEYEKWSLHQEWCSAVWAAHPSHDGLCVSRLEVRRSLPYQETASPAVQVSSHCYQCTLVHW